MNNKCAKRGPQWTGMREFKRLDTPGSISLQPSARDSVTANAAVSLDLRYRLGDPAGLPSMARIVSPVLIPAFSAGLPETTSTTFKPMLSGLCLAKIPICREIKQIDCSPPLSLYV